jgi:hypothetical protein
VLLPNFRGIEENTTLSFNEIISLKLLKVRPPPRLLANRVAIETLRISMRKRSLANLNNTLLDRLVRTGILNICFTERQKLSLLNVAGIPHPPIFHQSMLELNLIAVGLRQQSIEFPKVLPMPTLTDNRMQALIPILSKLLPAGVDGTMRKVAMAELAVISRALAIQRRTEDGIGGTNILRHRFNPGIGFQPLR